MFQVTTNMPHAHEPISKVPMFEYVGQELEEKKVDEPAKKRKKEKKSKKDKDAPEEEEVKVPEPVKEMIPI